MKGKKKKKSQIKFNRKKNYKLISPEAGSQCSKQLLVTEKAENVVVTNMVIRSSLVVQWLALGAFTAMAWLRSLVGELRSCKLRGAAKKKPQTNMVIVVCVFFCPVAWEPATFPASPLCHFFLICEMVP